MSRTYLSGVDFLLCKISSKLYQQSTDAKDNLFFNISLDDKLQIFMHRLHDYIELILTFDDLVHGREIFQFRIFHCCQISILQNLLPCCHLVQLFNHHAFSTYFLFCFKVCTHFCLYDFIEHSVLIHVNNKIITLPNLFRGSILSNIFQFCSFFLSYFELNIGLFNQ